MSDTIDFHGVAVKREHYEGSMSAPASTTSSAGMPATGAGAPWAAPVKRSRSGASDVDTQTVYVVDQDGRTLVSASRAEAEADLIREAWAHATHLTITKAEAPADLSGDALTDWCIANVPPITCPMQ